jgi:hypothetical protein
MMRAPNAGQVSLAKYDVAFGIQTWDASGNIIVDTSVRSGRVLGSFSSGTTAGSFGDAGLATGTMWYIVNPIIASGSLFGGMCPVVTASGSTLSWTFPTDPSGITAQASLVTYGVY